MSMRFRYKQLTARGPVPSLGGRATRPRPIIQVTLIGPLAVLAPRGLLDTSADDTVFPESFANQMGIDLTTAPVGQASGTGLATAQIRYAELDLRVSDGQEFRHWRAWVGFTSTPLKQPLLGFAGFLQYFTATFHGDLEEVELAVNTAYPGI
jgi:hypothetical protein